MTDSTKTIEERLAAANARRDRALARYEALRGELDAAAAAVNAAFALFRASASPARDAELEVQLLRRKPGSKLS